MGFSNSSEVRRLSYGFRTTERRGHLQDPKPQVFNYFVNKMVNISKKLGRETILWDVPRLHKRAEMAVWWHVSI